MGLTVLQFLLNVMDMGVDFIADYVWVDVLAILLQNVVFIDFS